MAGGKIFVVLAALLVASGCYARHESVPEVDLTDSEALALAAEVSVDAEDVGLALDAWGDLGSGKNFSLFCNGKRVTPDEDAARLGGNRTHVYSCWGTFKAFGRGKKEDVCFAAGTKCEGHWLYIKPACNARIAVCEGAVKRFRAVGIKKGGAKLAVIKAGGCVGKSAVALAPPKNESRDDGLVPLGWPAGMPQMWAGEYDGPHAALVKSVLGSSGEKTLAKATCEGLGGGATVIKKRSGCGCGGGAGGHAAEAGEAGFAALEGRVDEALAEAGVAVPPEPSLLPSMDLAAMLRGPPRCAVTCNGKRAWFGGKLPCMGRLGVKCDFDTPKGELEFAGACQGFWSGIFGGRCSGFTSAHTEFKDFDKYAFCAGKHGMFMKKGKRGFAFGGGCKGKGLAALQVEEEDDD